MNNTEHFGKLTERMQAFREEVLDAKPYIDAQRAVLATEAYKENQNQPRVMVRALMLQKILEGMSIYIDDKSLIAGNQASRRVCTDEESEAGIRTGQCDGKSNQKAGYR